MTIIVLLDYIEIKFIFSDPDCCYYLHCPTLNHKVVPDPYNDIENAKEYIKYKENEKLKSKLHLTLSATFPKSPEYLPPMKMATMI